MRLNNRFEIDRRKKSWRSISIVTILKIVLRFSILAYLRLARDKAPSGEVLLMMTRSPARFPQQDARLHDSCSECRGGSPCGFHLIRRCFNFIWRVYTFNVSLCVIFWKCIEGAPCKQTTYVFALSSLFLSCAFFAWQMTCQTLVLS